MEPTGQIRLFGEESSNLKMQIRLVMRLSVPAILAQISTIIMEYIDASMVGSLGARASAAIGIVSTVTWLIGGLCSAVGIGFTVGIAHRMGAQEEREARKYVKSGFLTAVIFSCIPALIGIMIHRQLPLWLGGQGAMVEDASRYFLVFVLTLPVMQINYIGAGMLECSGNMNLPGIINIMMCALDILFNALFIYDGRIITVLNIPGGQDVSIYVPGIGLGVPGAAIGTLCAQICGAVCVLLAIFVAPNPLALRKEERGLLPLSGWIHAMKISLPVMLSSLIMGSAYVVSTRIVAPLGNISISANSFAITAESLCYMPGYGIAHAATTLVGQAKGAQNYRLEKRFALLTTMAGIVVMSVTAVLLYICAPQMIAILSPDKEVRKLGTEILRIEAFAEAMFGASIVAEGVFRGLGKTWISSALNLTSMWLVRLPLSAVAAGVYGLPGVWYIMCGELCFRGLIFLIGMALVFWKEEKANR